MGEPRITGSLHDALHQAVQDCQALLATAQLNQGLQAVLKCIQQLPVEWHAPQAEPTAVLLGFRELFGTLSSVFHLESASPEEKSQLSATVRDLLLALFVSTAPSTPYDPSSGHILLLSAISRKPEPPLPLLPRDALLLLFWIDTRLLHPETGLPKSKSHVTELLERSSSGNPEAGSAAAILLQGSGVPVLILRLLDIADGPDCPADDPSISELHVDVAAWGAATARRAVQELTDLKGSKSQGGITTSSARTVLVASLELASSALQRVNRAIDTSAEAFGPLAIKSMGTASDGVLQLGDAVLQAAALTGCDDPTTAKALVTTTDVYTAAAVVVATYCRMAGDVDAVELAVKLRSQLASVCWLCSSQSTLTNGHAEGAPVDWPAHGAGSADEQPWRWEIARPLTAGRQDDEPPARQLLRSILEVLSQLAGWCWRGGVKQPAQHVMMLPDTLPCTAEQQAQVLLLGRTFLLANHSEALARNILPLLADSLASKSLPLAPQVYSTILWVLAAMAGTSSAGHATFSWLTSQVLELLLHTYRNPSPKMQEALMYGSAGPTKRYGDSMALALQRLATGMEEVSTGARHELRRRLLQLFRDLGLRALPGVPSGQLPVAAWDLGALLPVIAASFASATDTWAALKGLSVKSSHSLDFMAQMQKSQAAIIQMLRDLWFHCAIHKFTDAGKWPPAWSKASGVIAAGTPALLVGSGPNRADDVLERLRAEMGTVVMRAGPRASLQQLSQQLAQLLQAPQGLLPPSAQIQAAFLLAVATAELTRAAHAPLSILSETSPLVLPQLYLQTAPAGSNDSAWYRALLVRCCHITMERLSQLRVDEAADPEDKVLVEPSAEALTGSLISALADSGGHSIGGAPPVVEVSLSLLQKLMHSFPSLYWSPRCLAALLGELEEEEGDRMLGQLASSTTATTALVWTELRSWLTQASQLAPTRTEALLHTFLTQAGTAVATAAHRRGAELLAACAASRQQSELAWSEVVMEQGAVAMARKQHFLGVVAAMQQQLDEQGASASTLAVKLEEDLQELLLVPRRDRELEQQYLTAAAYLAVQEALPQSHPTIQRLLQTICQAPAQRFTVKMMKLSVFAWTWVSVASPQLEEALLHQVASAWLSTAQQQLGLFSGHKTLPGPADESSREEASMEVLAGIRCHQQWLAFFNELWNATKDRASQNVVFQIFGTLLHKSLSDAHRLSRHPAAVGARFRLLTLGLMYTRLRYRQSVGRCPEAVALLNDRILKAGLDWFTEPPAWHHGCSQREAQERFFALRDFLATMEAASKEAKGRLPTLTTQRLQDTLSRLSTAGSSTGGSLPSTPASSRSTARSYTFGAGPGQLPLIGGGLEFSPPITPASCSETPVSVFAARAAAGVHPVWGPAARTPGDVERLQQLLRLLGRAEAERLEVWALPRKLPVTSAAPSGALQSLKDSQWREAVRTAWTINPRLALMLLQRHSTSAVARLELERLVAGSYQSPTLQRIPEAALLLATAENAKANAPELAALESWQPASAVEGLQLLSSAAGSHPMVKAYCMRCLRTTPPHKLAYFLSQLVQCLRHDEDDQLGAFLVDMAQTSHVFAHHLLWGLMAEKEPPQEAFNPTIKRSGWAPPKDFGLWGPAGKLEARLLASLSPEALAYWEAESAYFGAMNEISGLLFDVPKEERRAAANKLLQGIKPSRDDLYLPPCPDAVLLDALQGSATPMPSAAKVPILVAFEVEEPSVSVPTKQPLIFKVGDDVRQDVLALQVISILKDAFHSCGLDLYLRPYGVLPTGYETGIIEVVPNTKSRSGVGEITEGGLYDYFQIMFGQPGSPRFEAARRNFILSEAGYAIASYLLQCKDRHNGNLLIDNEGHLVHIDFGFILEISPGGNLGFESAAFKLSHEMTQLLDPGNARNSAHFKLFEEYCVRGYLVARTVAEPILAAVALMAEAGLPCFGRGAPMDNLRARFHLELSDVQAAQFIRGAINDAYQKWTTGFYDYIQYLQNGIPR